MAAYRLRVCVTLLVLSSMADPVRAQEEPEDLAPLSEATESCIDCHLSLHPGIVGDWYHSRHARTTMAQALALDVAARRVSVEAVAEELTEVAIGCAECHTHDPEGHPDTVEHFGYEVHTVVTPKDCAVCHPAEVEEYGHNLMAQAVGNLQQNPLYRDLVDQVNGPQTWDGAALRAASPHTQTDADSCFSCHGTVVEVVRKETRSTAIGDLEVAVLSGWPNQGVGRINPDGSKGSCASCHARHRFSIAMARKPYTCSQCHKGPDVPAYKVYEVSKHGNLHATLHGEWDFEAVPWVPGQHFTAPTCAVCHVSALANADGDELVARTHRMNDRLPMRLFGLPYAHPHPKDAATDKIRNKAGLPLPTELTGEPVAEAVIGAEEQAARRATLQMVCFTCHARSWVDGHFARLDHTIEATNAMTRAATDVLLEAWKRGAATGPGAAGSAFDEPIERRWVEQWLFYANATRFASAMMGADYGVFAGGRWQLARNLREMAEWLEQQGKKGEGR